MKTKLQRLPRLPDRVSPQFDSTIVPAAPARGRQESELERLKNRLLGGPLVQYDGTALGNALRQAANEAAAIAWMTPFPLLILPGLFEEKAASARDQLRRQSEVRQKTLKISLLETGAGR